MLITVKGCVHDEPVWKWGYISPFVHSPHFLRNNDFNCCFCICTIPACRMSSGMSWLFFGERERWEIFRGLWPTRLSFVFHYSTYVLYEIFYVKPIRTSGVNRRIINRSKGHVREGLSAFSTIGPPVADVRQHALQTMTVRTSRR